MKSSVIRALALLASILSLTGCFEKSVDTSELPCEPGVQSMCYSGPEGTQGVGVCRTGVSICAEFEGSAVEGCVGEVIPGGEFCDGVDNDCDGVVDEENVCDSEKAAELAAETGDFVSIQDSTSAGVVFMGRYSGGSLIYCPAGGHLQECVEGFLLDYGTMLGLQDPAVQLIETRLVTVGSNLVFHYQQMHKGLRVVGGGVAVVTRGEHISFVQGRVYPIPEALESMPAIDASEVVELLDSGTSPSSPELVVFIPAGEVGEVLSTVEQTPQLAWHILVEESEVAHYETYIDAIAGEELLRVSVERDSLVLTIDDNVAGATYPDGTAPPASQAWARAVFDGVNSLFDFVILTDPLGLDVAAPHPATTMNAILLDSTNSSNPADSGFTCGPAVPGNPTCAQGLLGCNSGATLWLCDLGTQVERLENLAHEWFHGVTLNVGWNPPRASAENNALVEFWAMTPSELFQCWSNAAGAAVPCDWKHAALFPNPGREFSLKWCQTNVIGIGNVGPHHLAVLPGTAFRMAYDGLEDTFSQTEAVLKLQHVLFSTLLVQLDGAQFKDFALAAVGVCNDMAAAGESFAVAGNTYVVDATTCNFLHAGFQAFGFVDCSFPTEEICDGIDNDCDGRTDEAPGATGASYTLEKVCFDGPAGKLDVGQCQAGLQTCGVGGWGPCLGQQLPAQETCNSVDDDCDGEVDEEVLEPFAQDLDGDGFWNPATLQYFCQGDWQTLGLVGANNSDHDCDDMDANVFPQDGVETICEVIPPLVDHDCDGVADDGCACSPATYVPQFCGAVVNDVDCVTYDSGLLEQCTVGEYPYCKVGKTQCMWNQQANPAKFEVSDVCFGASWGGAEICDNLDNDCDGMVDEDPSGACTEYFLDTDQDGWGQDISQCLCWPDPATNQTALEPGDCDDGDASIYPGADELPDAVDNDCDGSIDEDFQGPCFVPGQLGECALGKWAVVGGDLSCQNIYYASDEICDGKDNDCDGATDEWAEATCPPTDRWGEGGTLHRCWFGKCLDCPVDPVPANPMEPLGSTTPQCVAMGEGFGKLYLKSGKGGWWKCYQEICPAFGDGANLVAYSTEAERQLLATYLQEAGVGTGWSAAHSICEDPGPWSPGCQGTPANYAWYPPGVPAEAFPPLPQDITPADFWCNGEPNTGSGGEPCGQMLFGGGGQGLCLNNETLTDPLPCICVIPEPAP